MRRNSILLPLIAGAVAGGFAVALGMRALDGSSKVLESGTPPADATRAPVDPAEVRLDDPARPIPPERTAAATERTVQAELPLFSPALLEHARDGLHQGWRRERTDAMPDDVLEAAMEEFRGTVLELPRAIGRRLAREQTAREAALEDARTGGVFALLQRLDAGGAGPVLELVRDDADFEQLFRRDVAEGFVDGASGVASREAVPDGTTLSFPAGVFRLSDFTAAWSSSQPFPRDVTIAGAGMNATLLVGGDLSSRAKLRNLRFRDCTVYSSDDYLFDVRVDGTVVRLDRVRVCGFDMAAGGSCAFGTDTLALHCVDSVLTGGYGRAPGSGELFDVRTDGLVARFDRCTIEGVRVGTIRPGGTLVMRACTLRDMLDDPQALAASHPGVLLDQCSVHLFEGEYSERREALRRDLNELFPSWEQALR